MLDRWLNEPLREGPYGFLAYIHSPLSYPMERSGGRVWSWRHQDKDGIVLDLAQVGLSDNVVQSTACLSEGH